MNADDSRASRSGTECVVQFLGTVGDKRHSGMDLSSLGY